MGTSVWGEVGVRRLEVSVEADETTSLFLEVCETQAAADFERGRVDRPGERDYARSQRERRLWRLWYRRDLDAGYKLAKTTDIDPEGDRNSVQLDASFPGKGESEFLALQFLRPLKLHLVRMDFARHRIPQRLALRWCVGGLEHDEQER